MSNAVIFAIIVLGTFIIVGFVMLVSMNNSVLNLKRKMMQLEEVLVGFAQDGTAIYANRVFSLMRNESFSLDGTTDLKIEVLEPYDSFDIKYYLDFENCNETSNGVIAFIRGNSSKIYDISAKVPVNILVTRMLN